MDNSMRYITIEEQKKYEQIAASYNMKGYSPPNSLVCNGSYHDVEEKFGKRGKTKRPPRKK